VGYDSHTFNEAERNYPVYDCELLALVRGLLRWEHVLLSSPFPVKVYTDHNNLCYYRSPRNIAQRVARYMSKLADFNFEIIYKPGATNQADALSRHLAIPKGENDNEDVVVLPDKLFVQAIEVASIEARVWEAQQKHTATMEKWVDEYQLERDAEGWWWKADAPVVPEDNQL
jgi:RNase H-like domain found in reverse transcriptase